MAVRPTFYMPGVPVRDEDEITCPSRRTVSAMYRITGSVIVNARLVCISTQGAGTRANSIFCR